MYAKLTIPERLKDLRVVDKHLTLEQLAEATLAQVPAIDADFANLLAHTGAEHRETLDRLATT